MLLCIAWHEAYEWSVVWCGVAGWLALEVREFKALLDCGLAGCMRGASAFTESYVRVRRGEREIASGMKVVSIPPWLACVIV